MHEYKVGDWIYTTEFTYIDIFRITKIEDTKVFDGPNGWVDIDHSSFRLALPHEIPIEFRPKISKQQKEKILNLIDSI